MRTNRTKSEGTRWAGVMLVAPMIACCCTAACGQNNELKEPTTVVSKDGQLASPLTVVFGNVDVTGPKSDTEISVRAYGLNPTQPLIPGPTFAFHPGDLVRLHLHNFMNHSTNPALNQFEDNSQQSLPGIADDIDGHVSHEISIPNNADMTNLHVHGLHVDPKQDDVTLIILPEDGDPSSLVPMMQRLVPTINRWWTRPYKYKIPEDHVPGTFWYHAHKHGSTATQVENGMAGTLVMLPNSDNDSIVPGLWNNDQSRTHDRVMVLQGINNVGTPNGKGNGPFRNVSGGNPVLTVNGQFQPALQLPPGQTERWRFVFAGANHRAAGSIWVGKMLLKKIPEDLRSELQAINTSADARAYTRRNNPKKFPNTPLVMTCVSIPGRVRLVAVDGVPMWEAVKITPTSPTFGAPGNRNDLIISVDDAAKESGPYFVYQNYPLELSDLAKGDPKLFGKEAGAAAAARFNALSKGKMANGLFPFTYIGEDGKPTPNKMLTDPYMLASNYTGHTQPWTNVDEDGNPIPATNSSPNPTRRPVGPLLHGEANEQTGGVDVRIRAQRFPQDLGWQPMGGSGQSVAATILVRLKIDGKASGPPMPSDKKLNERLSQISPATHNFNPETTRLKKLNKHGQLVKGIPSYVSPIPDKFDGRQVVTFDRGQFTFDYTNKTNGSTLSFRQFWLNGRQFSPDDFVGNPISTELIQSDVVNVEPHLGRYSPNAAETYWTHRVGSGLGEKLLVTNPGYYRKVTKVGSGFNYEKADPNNLPTYMDLTGLKEPRQPESTTAEEWLLVNNSDMFHPFHIHISPFFVEEIGQLNYDAKAPQGQQWTLFDLKDSDSPFKWVAGNWWDVILLPPHGYVKFKTWMNVPVQLPANSADPNSELVSIENANVYGSWVLHCHILRHEDRGMMTMVNTRPKPNSLAGKWFDGNTPLTIADEFGSLQVTGMSGTTIRGDFNEGLGNPFKTQPWAGAMFFQTSAGSTTKTFNVTDNLKEIVFSDGSRWTKSMQPQGGASRVPIDLSGPWTDVDGNRAFIEQRAASPASFQLRFRPQSQVWWGKGRGSWPGGVSVKNSNALSYAGTQTLVNDAGRNQLITFTVTADGKSIVFGNGIKWMRP